MLWPTNKVPKILLCPSVLIPARCLSDSANSLYISFPARQYSAKSLAHTAFLLTNDKKICPQGKPLSVSLILNGGKKISLKLLSIIFLLKIYNIMEKYNIGSDF